MNAATLNVVIAAALPSLTGTPKQVAFAEKIRHAWQATQLETIEQEQRIARGEGTIATSLELADGDLAPGNDPKDPMITEGFKDIAARRAETLAKLLARRTSAKEWIESNEGHWVLQYGPMARKAA